MFDLRQGYCLIIALVNGNKHNAEYYIDRIVHYNMSRFANHWLYLHLLLVFNGYKNKEGVKIEKYIKFTKNHKLCYH